MDSLKYGAEEIGKINKLLGSEGAIAKFKENGLTGFS